MAEVSAVVKAALKPPKAKADAVTVGNPLVVGKALLNPLKTLCRERDANVNETARYLLLSLASRSGLVRMRALFVIDYLFNRSKLFRQLVNEDISTVVNCCSTFIGVHRQSGSGSSGGSGGAPDGYAAEIETKVKELVELWDLRHGADWPKLHCMARYLRESLRLAMPNVQASALSHLARIEANRAVLLKKVVRRSEKVLRDELSVGCAEAEDSLSKLEACFAILFPPTAQSNKVAAAVVSALRAEPARVSTLDVDDEGVEWEDDEDDGVGFPSSLAQDDKDADGDESGGDSLLFADGIAPFAMTIDLRQGLKGRCRDTAVLEETIRELSSHLRRFVAPQLQSWQHILSRGLRVYKDCAVQGSDGGSVLDGRRGGEVAAVRQQTEDALRSVALLLRRVNALLGGRCRDFLDAVEEVV